MKYSIAMLFASFIMSVEPDKHLHTIGPFGKRQLATDTRSLDACNPQTDVASLAAIQITLDLTAVAYSSNQQINLNWTSPQNTCTDDFIGIYFIETPVSAVCDFFDYEFVENQQNVMSWQMVNLRRPLEFRYYSREQNCLGNYSLIGKSATIQPSNPNEPVHIHLAYGDRIDQMFVSYLTNSSQYIPQCQYGLDPSVLNYSNSGTTTTYNATDMCEEKANITGPRNFIHPGYMHTILLEDLRPSTTYYYRVGTDQYGWSSIYSFRNRPSDENEEVYLIAYGDMGTSPVEPGAKSTMNRVAARIQSSNVTCLLHLGDISYAEGRGAVWDTFMTQIQSITAYVPYMISIGNHDYDYVVGGEKDPSGAPSPGGFRPSWGNYGHDSGGECAVPMVHRFHSPSNGNGVFWYSFDVGPIHILIFSAEHDFQTSSVQYNWTEHDLQSVNRSRTPWIIVGAHRPMYTSENYTSDLAVAEMLRLHLEPLFYKYHVDVTLMAHFHAYERTCPMYQQKCIKDGTTHAVIGMAGEVLDSGSYLTVEWSEYRDRQFGYSTIYANKTYLNFTYYHNTNDDIADQFILKKAYAYNSCDAKIQKVHALFKIFILFVFLK